MKSGEEKIYNKEYEKSGTEKEKRGEKGRKKEKEEKRKRRKEKKGQSKVQGKVKSIKKRRLRAQESVEEKR